MTESSMSHISAVLNLIEQPALLVDNELNISFINSAAISLLGNIQDQSVDKISYFIPVLGILKNAQNDDTQLPYTIKSEITDIGTLIYTVSKPDKAASFSMILIKKLDAIETKKVPPRDYRQALLDMEKMRTMQLISAGAAHEINNPLGGIMQSVQVLSRVVDFADKRTLKKLSELGITENSVEDMKKYHEDRRMANFLEIVRDCGERSSSMITKLLSFCRFKEIKTGRIILNDLIETALFITRIDNELRKVYDFRFTKVNIEENPPVLEINADDQTLIHAMFLLMKQMAIKQYGRRQQQDIETEMNINFFRVDSSKVAVEISDNGLPFTDEEQQIFMQDYFDLEPQNELLSLPISRYLVENKNGGKVYLEANESGNKVRFEFPFPRP